MRRSKQRAAVYEAVKSTTCHPDAEWVYGKVRETLPSVSLGTVYRNLKQLAFEKKLDTLETELGKLHYDADLSPHMHFVCDRCGKISDLFMESGLKDKLHSAGLNAVKEKIIIYGICPCCEDDKKQKIKI